MADLTYVCFYLSYQNILSPLSDAALGKLTRAMLKYADTGEVTELSGRAAIVWPYVRFQIDCDKNSYRERCEKNRINGYKGGRPPKNPAVFQKPKENEKENENGKEKEKDSIYRPSSPSGETAGSPSPFFPPDVQQVRQYVAELGLQIDPERFVDHYTSNGWMIGSSPMQDWKAALRNWSRKEFVYGKTELEPTEYRYGNIL